mmetsp:Transcript_40686/g.74418  ORF Transcript_40686/g.74418 Transcript_40686/m.74418 type:complete len:89 (+) Transcript_40686:1513-1779(+)
MIIARKGDTKKHHDPMHDQSEQHAHEHAKGLKQWFLKRFDDGLPVVGEGAVRAMKVHHGFGADATSRAEEDGEEEEDDFREAACLYIG